MIYTNVPVNLAKKDNTKDYEWSLSVIRKDFKLILWNFRNGK